MINNKNGGLYNKSVPKNRIFKSTDNSITFDNSCIKIEECSLEESLCSEDELVFGTCESSEINVTVLSNKVGICKGKRFFVDDVINNDTTNPIRIGTYLCEEEVLSADRQYKTLTMHDFLAEKLNTNYADWYNNLTNFPTTLKEFRDKFFETGLKIAQEYISLANDNMPVYKTLQPEVLSGRDILFAICSLNGVFGHWGKDNTFHYIKLEKSNTGAYPNTFFPKQVYPGQSSGPTFDRTYLNLEYASFDVKNIDKIILRASEDEIGGTAGSGNNAYVLEGNFLINGLSQTDLDNAATNLLNAVKNITYVPFKADVSGNPCFEVGDPIRFVTNDGKVIESFIISRTLKGIQAPKDNYSAEGKELREEKPNSLQSKFMQQDRKFHLLEVTTEQLRSVIGDESKGLISEINQLSSEIDLKVSSSEFTSTIQLLDGKIAQKITSADAESIVKQTADSWSLSVTSGENGTQIKVTGDGVTIQSDNIDLHVKSVNIDGTITADAIVANTQINSPSIIGGSISIGNQQGGIFFEVGSDGSVEIGHMDFVYGSGWNLDLREDLTAAGVSATVVEAQAFKIKGSEDSYGKCKMRVLDADGEPTYIEFIGYIGGVG